jgi:hypothetical protein
MIKPAFLIPLFNTFKDNPVIGFWFIFFIFLVYVTYKIFLSLTNKYRGYSILFTVVYLCFSQIIFDQFSNLSTAQTISIFLRYILIFSTIFFIIQNNYLTKKLIPLSIISTTPAIILMLTGLYLILITTPLEQEVIDIFPDVNNAADLYLYLIKNNLFLPYIYELLTTSTLIESLGIIIEILLGLIENIIVCLGFYYWTTHILFKEEEQKSYGE